MRTKKVNRYYCDFCKYARCASWATERHEKRCTMNPNRECGLCKAAGLETKPAAELVALLPNPSDYEIIDFENVDGTGHEYKTYPGLRDAVTVAMLALRDAVDDCPACILSALRQAGCAGDAEFQYNHEVKEFWLIHNEAIESSEHYG